MASEDTLHGGDCTWKRLRGLLGLSSISTQSKSDPECSTENSLAEFQGDEHNWATRKAVCVDGQLRKRKQKSDGVWIHSSFSGARHIY